MIISAICVCGYVIAGTFINKIGKKRILSTKYWRFINKYQFKYVFSYLRCNFRHECLLLVFCPKHPRRADCLVDLPGRIRRVPECNHFDRHRFVPDNSADCRHIDDDDCRTIIRNHGQLAVSGFIDVGLRAAILHAGNDNSMCVRRALH